MQMFLTPFGSICLVLETFLSVAVLCMLIGKFFNARPFNKYYDVIYDQSESEGVAIFQLLVAIVIATILAWIGIIGEFELLTEFSVVAASVCTAFTILYFTICAVDAIIPYIKNVHHKIVKKTNGE